MGIPHAALGGALSAHDEYRCFVLDWPETAVRYVSGFRGNPGRPSIVHHIIGFLAKPDEVASYEALVDAAEKLRAAHRSALSGRTESTTCSAASCSVYTHSWISARA